MNKKQPTLPDLTRQSNCLGKFDNDINFTKILESFSKRIFNAGKHHGYSADKVIDTIFNGRYSEDDIKYRSGIQKQLIENSNLFKLWNTSISKMNLYVPLILNDFDEDDKLIKKAQLNLKWVRLPKTIDTLIDLPKNTQGFIDLAQFAKESKDNLEEFFEITKKYEQNPFLVKKNGELTANIEQNNTFIDEIEPFRDNIKKFISVRHQMSYHKAMAIPFTTSLKDGTIIPSCTPEIIDKNLREANFVDAYNPSYFKIQWQHGGTYSIHELNVPNNFEYNNENRMTFVLGPNNRGKSVYVRTIGLNMQLAMNGSNVFAKEAKFSPVDYIFTCFDMGDSVGAGHFHTGAKKIQNMRDNVTPHSLVLVDETGGGTEPNAEAWVAKGVATALINNNITSVYITHEKGIWKQYTKEKNISFLQTSDLDDDKRVYKIFPGIIQTGYGKRIVKEAGIDPKTLHKTISNRFKTY